MFVRRCILLLCIVTVIRFVASDGTCSASIGGACPPTWIQWGARCYKVTASQTYTWQEAGQACRAMGGEMVVPHSDEENGFLENLQPTWINCNKFQTEGVWECKEGTRKVDYTNWNPGPGGPKRRHEIEDCAMMGKCAASSTQQCACGRLHLRYTCSSRAYPFRCSYWLKRHGSVLAF